MSASTAPTDDAPIEVELEALTQDPVQHDEGSDDDVISLESGFSELLSTEDAEVEKLRKRCNELEEVNARLCQEKDELVVKRHELESRVETLEDQLSQKPVASCDYCERCDALVLKTRISFDSKSCSWVGWRRLGARSLRRLSAPK